MNKFVISYNYFVKHIEIISLLLLKFLIFLSPMIVFLSLPPFRIGVWSKLEPVICGLYAISASVSFFIFILCLIKPYKYFLFCLHPIVIFPAFLGILSLLNSPFCAVPLLNIFGDPRFGQGAVRYLCIASLCAGTLICCHFKDISKYIAILCLAVCLAVIGLVFFAKAFPQWHFHTYMFVDYLAFFGIYITVILFAAFPRSSLLIKGIFVFIGMFIIFYSQNKSAMLVIPVLCIIVCFIIYFFKTDIKKLRFFGVLISILIPITFTFLIIIINANIKTVLNNGEAYQFTNTTVNRSLYSLHSRSLLSNIAVKAILTRPSLLINGLGWGHYSNQLICFAGQKDISLYEEDKWDALSRGDWHSHNEYIETTISSGLPGLILWFCFFCSLPLFCKKELIYVTLILTAVLSGLFCLWFQFPPGIPFMAICFAFISSPLSEHNIGKRFNIKRFNIKRFNIKRFNIKTMKYIGYCILSVIFIAEIYAFSSSLILGLQYNKIENYFFPSSHKVKETTVLNIKSVIDIMGPGGIHFATVYRKIIESKLELKEEIKSLSDIYLFTNVYNLINTTSTKKALLFYVAGLTACNKMALALNVWENTNKENTDKENTDKENTNKENTNKENTDKMDIHLKIWEARVMEFLEKASLRTDMAIPYLLWCLSKNDDVKVIKMAEFILKNNSNDPVGLWFYGIVLSGIENGSHYKSIQYLNRSLKNGIELFMPIDSTIKQKIIESEMKIYRTK